MGVAWILVDYWLDSNVFIEGRKGPYGFDLAPRFWNILEEMVHDGRLACPALVYSELQGVSDDLATWVRDHKNSGMFVDPDVSVQKKFQIISTYTTEHYPDNLPRKRFLDRADPWTIAHAMAKGGTVVTLEKINKARSSKVKIPNVCEHFNIPCVDTYQMLRNQGFFWT